MGLASAVHCAQTASEALDAGDLSADFLSAYQEAWTAAIGKELKQAKLLHRMMGEMSDKQLDYAVKVLDDPALKALIVKHGDIDFPSKLARVALRKSPQLLRLTGPAVRALL
jgi:flavin-dependent dehydrogenase